ncbi:MAG: OmpP1/FadL family transporter [Bacteroidota bacterium]
MKATKYIMLIGVMLFTLTVFGQIEPQPFGYYKDALLFSQTSSSFGSTARVQGFGGASASLGGDVSVIGVNPAGIGFFNRSVFSVTPGLNFHSAEANYFSNQTTSYRSNFNIANVGVVLNNTVGDIVNTKFKGGSFAISLQRVNDFNNEVKYQGRNDNNSVIDAFIEEAGTQVPNDLGDQAYAAYNNYLINPVYDGNNQLVGYDAFTYGYPYQSESIITSGGQYQLNLAWGGNYNDRVYFGGGLGIQTISFSRRRSFLEDQYQPFDSLSNTRINDELNINGSGINATFGVIVRPISMLTVGVSYVTPTFYALNDEYSFTHNTRWNGAEVIEDGQPVTLNQLDYTSDISISNYTLRSPSRLTLGTSLFFGKMGFITGDVEIVNYTAAHLGSSDFSTTGDNNFIQDEFRSAINYRLGAEARLNAFRVRAGYSYLADPYSGSDYDFGKQNLSAGLGFRKADYFVELAYVNTTFNSVYQPYTISVDQPAADIQNQTNSFLFTFGFNF